MRYIIIEVDDDAIAEALVEKLSHSLRFRVAAMFHAFRARCTCGGIHPRSASATSSNSMRLRRGSKYGFVVHEDCGKAMVGHHSLIRNLITNPQSRYLVDMMQIRDPGVR